MPLSLLSIDAIVMLRIPVFQQTVNDVICVFLLRICEFEGTFNTQRYAREER